MNRNSLLRNSEFGLRFAAVVVVLAMAPTVALAYIDPGNGAYMVQALFALVGAGLFYVRHPIRSAKALWRWVSHRGRHASDAESADAIAVRPHPSVQDPEKLSSGLTESREDSPA